MSWDLKLALNLGHYAICLVFKKKKNLEMNQQRFSLKRKKKIFQITGEGNNIVHGARGNKQTTKHLRVPGWGGSPQWALWQLLST